MCLKEKKWGEWKLKLNYKIYGISLIVNEEGGKKFKKNATGTRKGWGE